MVARIALASPSDASPAVARIDDKPSRCVNPSRSAHPAARGLWHQKTQRPDEFGVMSDSESLARASAKRGVRNAEQCLPHFVTAVGREKGRHRSGG